MPTKVLQMHLEMQRRTQVVCDATEAFAIGYTAVLCYVDLRIGNMVVCYSIWLQKYIVTSHSSLKDHLINGMSYLKCVTF